MWRSRGIIRAEALSLVGLLAVAAFAVAQGPNDVTGVIATEGGRPNGQRFRVVVSSDIGGTDPDDFQSLVHLLLYADVLDIEGLISSPYGPGRKEDLLQVVDLYERDYVNLSRHSAQYPAPNALREIIKQGATEVAPYGGVANATEGSDWIVRCARRDDPRPLHILVWGGLEDLAQALHDRPEILPRLRVYWIGGPNKKWSPDAYLYLVNRHPGLWFIEANATYRGWFVGGNQEGEWGNREFVTRHLAGHGALGAFFARQLGGSLKMGDSPSVAWLLWGRPEDPSKPGWGGRFVRAWKRPYLRCERLPTPEDTMELFGILEMVLPVAAGDPEHSEARLSVENQMLVGHLPGDGTIRFRFCPKSTGVHRFELRSNIPGLDGRTGAITVVAPELQVTSQPSPTHPHWWTDDPAPGFAEGGHAGARTVSRWREAFLGDFANRMQRCLPPRGD